MGSPAKRQAILKDLKAHPERHRHTFDELRACCFYDGALDLDLMQRHEGLSGRGPKCDVTYGECSCGAFHKPDSVVDILSELST
jgi:hypothetical protein